MSLFCTAQNSHAPCKEFVTISNPLYITNITAQDNHRYIIRWMYGFICSLIASNVFAILYSLAYCHCMFDISLIALSCILSLFTDSATLSSTLVGEFQKLDQDFSSQKLCHSIQILKKTRNKSFLILFMNELF